MPALGVLFGQPVGARVSLIIKPADQTGSGTTPVADDDLFFETQPNSVYWIEISIIGMTTGTVSTRYNYSHSGTTTYFLTQVLRASSGHTQTTLQSGIPAGQVVFEGNMGTQFGHSSSTTDHGGVHSKAILQTGASGGLFEIYFNSTAGGSNAVIKAGSYMRVKGLVV